MPDRDDLDRELDFHVEMQTRRYEAAGLDHEAARRRALERLGDLEAVRVRCRTLAHSMEATMDRGAWWQGLWQDVRYAWRTARKAPLFSATAVVTIGIGIGASTAIFSVVNAVLLKSVAYERPHELAVLWNSYAATGLSEAAISAAEFTDITERQRAFEAVAAMRPQASSVAGGCGTAAGCAPERVWAYFVSPSFFELLRIAPARGRQVVDADGAAGAPPAVVLSDTVWRRRFGADPAIVGQQIVVGAVSRTVIAVMPPGVRFPDAAIGFMKQPADVWIPYDWTRNRTDGRGNQNLGVVARIRSGESQSRAQADLDAIAQGFRREHPNRYAGPGINWRLKAVSLSDQMLGDVRPSLIVLGAAVGFVLLIACANVANLLLARGTIRRRELGVRTALGASRGRLVRQLFVEALLLAGAGGALGVLLALAGVQVLSSLDPGNIPYLDRTGIDLRVLLVSAALSVLTAMLIGLAPAIRQSMVDPQASLAEGGRVQGAAPVRRRMRGALVVTEVTLAAIVLVGAGLLVRSFAAMSRVPLGFDPERTAVAQVALPRARYDTSARVVAFERELVARLAALPGVRRASAVHPLPMSAEGWGGTLIIRDWTAAPGEPDPHAEYAVAMPEYFPTLGIPILEGRDFGPQDIAGAPAVAVVDEELARKYWPGESAVGKHLGTFGRPQDDTGWTTVIGVVGHVRNGGPRKEGEPQVYLAALQKPEFSLYYVARSSGSPAPLPAAMRAAVRELDPELPVATLAETSQVVARVIARDRFNTLIFTIFGGVALALATIGLYGVMAFLIAERTREIGIRLALGGRPARVRARLIGEGLTLAVIGVGLGLGIALILARTMKGLLFEIEPGDPWTYVAIASLLVLVAAAASAVPARRALRINPIDVLNGQN